MAIIKDKYEALKLLRQIFDEYPVCAEDLNCYSPILSQDVSLDEDTIVLNNFVRLNGKSNE